MIGKYVHYVIIVNFNFVDCAVDNWHELKEDVKKSQKRAYGHGTIKNLSLCIILYLFYLMLTCLISLH